MEVLKLYGVQTVVRYYRFQRLAGSDHVVVVVVNLSPIPLAEHNVGIAWRMLRPLNVYDIGTSASYMLLRRVSST